MGVNSSSNSPGGAGPFGVNSMARGSDVHSPFHQTRRTLLHDACRKGDLPLVKKLIEDGANITQRDKDGSPPSYHACLGGHVQVVEYLVSKGASINCTQEDKRTPLFHASDDGNMDMVECLCRVGATVNIADTKGQTPLHLASRRGHLAVVKCLVRNGAAISMADKKGMTPVHCATTAGRVETVTFLVSEGADITGGRRGNDRSLLLPNVVGNVDMVKCLCELGVNVNITNTRRQTPLHLASNEGAVAVVECLVKYGANIHRTDNDEETPLYYAGRGRHLKVIEFLVGQGADINSKKGRYGTPLNQASELGNIKTVDILCELGADVDMADSAGLTPIHVAGNRGHLAVVKCLVQHGADVHRANLHGETPLYSACTTGRVDVVEFLADNGSYVNCSKEGRNIPLMKAVEESNAPMVECLCKLGAWLNKPDSKGQTPLHVACAMDVNLEVVHTLIRYGADLKCEDNFGFSALRYLKPDSLSRAISTGLNDLSFTLLEQKGITFFAKKGSVEQLLLSWTGEHSHGLLSAKWSTAAKMEFAINLLRADNPVLLFDPSAYSEISDSIIDIKEKHEIQFLERLVNELKNKVPSLLYFSRAAIRNRLRRKRTSFLQCITHFAGEVSLSLISFIFLHEDALEAFPSYREQINSYFKRQLKESGFCAKAGDAAYDPGKRDSGIDAPLLIKAMSSSVSSNITDGLDWMLTDIARRCTDLNTANATDDSLGQIQAKTQFQKLDREICVSSCRKSLEGYKCSTSAMCNVHKCIEKVLKRCLSKLGPAWELYETGSFYLGNKIISFDELDFIAKTRPSHLDISSLDESSFNMRYKVTLALEEQHNVRQSLKDYVHLALELYLRGLGRPDDPAGGRVWVRACYPHPRGPGVCVQLAWVCEKGHTHDLGVDLSPAIEWREKCIKEVWKLPVYFDQPPLNAIRDRVASLPVLLVPSRDTTIDITDNHVTTNWDITFCHIKPSIFDCLDSISPNITVVYRLSKYLREFLPRKLKYSQPTSDIAGSWKSSSLISSYVLYNTLLQEVVQHPSPDDWAHHLIPDRLASLLSTLSSLTYIDFFMDIREQTLSLAYLNKPQRDILRRQIRADLDLISEVISSNTDAMNSSEVVIETIQLEQYHRDMVSVLRPDIKTGHIRYHVVSEGRLRYDTGAIRREIGVQEGADLYYYQIPKLQLQCNLIGRIAQEMLCVKFGAQ